MLRSGMVLDQVLLSLFLFSVFSVRCDTGFGENDDLIIKEYVEKNGYELKAHVIETTDGYALVFHRISSTKPSPSLPTQRQPVLLQHGLGMSSAAFLTPDKEALAYVLADSGYDVWLANSRGNRYSRQRVNQTSSVTTDKEFWRFSIHELAVTDLTAAIKYILNKTDQTSLHYVGHSHGGAFAFALLASEPLYRPSFASVITLAPTTFLNGLGTNSSYQTAKSLIETLAHESERFERENSYHILSSVSEVYSAFCRNGKKCIKTMATVAGTIDESSWMDILRFQPSRTSTKFVQYVLQQIKNGPTFKQHDFGAEENRKRYGSIEPSPYNLSAIKNPIDIIYTDTDIFVTNEDIEHHQSLMEGVKLHRVNSTNFNHFDFLWGASTKVLVNKKIINLLESYQLQLKHKIRETTLVSTQDVKNITERSFKDLPKLLPHKVYYNDSEKSFEKSNSRLISNYARVVQVLLDYELNSKGSLLYFWLNSTEIDDSKKVSVLKDIANILDNKCSTLETREVLKTVKSLDVRKKLPITAPLTTPYYKQLDFNPKYCPVISTEKLFINIMVTLLKYKYELLDVFDLSKFKSAKVSNDEKVKLILEIIQYLRERCTKQCPDFPDIMIQVYELQRRIKETGRSDQIFLLVPNEILSENDVAKKPLNNALLNHGILTEKIIELYVSILKRLAVYESTVHSQSDYSQLASKNKTNTEKLNILRQIVLDIDIKCRKGCSDVKEIVKDIDKLYQLLKQHRYIDHLNITTTSIILQVEELIKNASKPVVDMNQIKDQFIIIINKILSFEVRDKIDINYGFLLLPHLTLKQKVTRVLQRVKYLILERCTVDKCTDLFKLENDLKMLIINENTYFNDITLICSEDRSYCQVERSNDSLNTNVKKDIKTSSFTKSSPQDSIRKELQSIEELIREEMDEIDEMYLGQSLSNSSRNMDSLLVTTKVTDNEMVYILLERVKFLKDKCKGFCQNLNDVENKLKAIQKELEDFNSSDKTKKPFTNRDEFMTVIIPLKEYESKLATNFDYSFMNTPGITDKMILRILLERIKYIRKICISDCQGLNELEKKVKRLDKKLVKPLKVKPSKSKIKSQNPKGKSEIRYIINTLRDYDHHTNSKFDYSLFESSNMSEPVMTVILLDRVKQLKGQCKENCGEINEVEDKLVKLSNYRPSYPDKKPNSNFDRPPTTESTETKFPLTKESLQDYYGTLLDKFTKYDLDLGVSPKFDYSVLTSPLISNSDKIDIIFHRLLLLQQKCVRNCDEISDLMKNIKELRYKIDAEIINPLDLTRGPIPYDSLTPEKISSPEYQEIRDEYLLIVKILKAYEQKIKSNFDLSVLEQSKTNTEKLNKLMKRILHLKKQCKNNCSEILNLAEKLVKFKVRLNQQVDFNFESLDLTVPKTTYTSWLEDYKQPHPIIKRIRKYKDHINSTYFDGPE